MDTLRLRPTPRATDGTKGCPAQRGSKGDLMRCAEVASGRTAAVSDSPPVRTGRAASVSNVNITAPSGSGVAGTQSGRVMTPVCSSPGIRESG
ncbi:hypothetical protein ACFXPA_47840 [Amycolatopsis sp. NPDC059090]|uniref:hypothetical protein n=1 Tax=Amycolatopsis sp. NPDC059090 TaxID=3346723 RepID=UPI00366A832E